MALTFVAVCLCCSCINLQKSFPTGGGTILAGVWRGSLFLEASTNHMQVAYVEISAPRFGAAYFTYFAAHSFKISIPFPFFLLVALLWIALREWQRQRAAKGQPCPQ
jgi:hypothetical protein